MKRKDLVAWACMLSAIPIWAQDVPKLVDNVKWLNTNSSEQTQKAASDKAEAIRKASALKLPIKFKQQDGGIAELVSFNGGIPVYRATTNSASAATISTNKVYPGGTAGLNLTGAGVVLSEWDGNAVLGSHQELVGRVAQQDGVTNVSDPHSTHVAGTMIASGVLAAAKGMSYQATLQAYDFNNNIAELSTNNTLASNHSYGNYTGWAVIELSPGAYYWVWFGDVTISTTEDYKFGFYDATAQSWDQLLFNKPSHLAVKAAGNDRLEGPNPGAGHYYFPNPNGNTLQWSTASRTKDGNTTGYNTVTDAGNAKNVLTVGAVNDIPAGYSGPSSVLMSTFSCFGPTDDGRIKPDVVANGTSLYSTSSTGNLDYYNESGTSMATPSVTGSVGLLLQHEKNLYGANNFRSSTMKALVLHTADDAGNAGPDYQFGWGLMNTASAAKVISDHAAYCRHIKEFNLDNGNTIELLVNKVANQNLKVTISWIDPAGTSPALSLNPTTKMLVNDLDLRLISPSSVTYSPYVLGGLANPTAVATAGDNTVDNVEQILVTDPAAGVYKVRINHKGTLSGGNQIVSVIITGNDGVINRMNLNNITLNSGAVKNYSYRSLYASNFKALSGSRADFKAQQSITFDYGTNFYNGAVVRAEINSSCSLTSSARKSDETALDGQSHSQFNDLVQSQMEAGDLFVYPNPISSGYLNFNKTVADIKLSNVDGEVVLKTQNTNRISVDGLAKGLYILHLDDTAQKVVIE